MKRHSNAVRGNGNAHREKKLHTQICVSSLSYALHRYLVKNRRYLYRRCFLCVLPIIAECFSRPPPRRRTFVKPSEDLLLFSLVVMLLDDSFGRPQVASKFRRRYDFLFFRSTGGVLILRLVSCSGRRLLFVRVVHEIL